ncbi:MAG: MdtA/MuxA family multidrug efflux RND transporter periplasmic adaptor subunit [Burkholderiales bacterium]|nr:MdtA/MuxA family multidrug efflux RND transporter periplasmic adaptor subunit [Burkholderiales bacterium]
MRSTLLASRLPVSYQRGRMRWWAALAVLALAAGGASVWWWQQRGAQPAASASAAPAKGGGPRLGPGGAAQPVSVGVVRRQDMRVLVGAIGTLNARATAVVRSKVSGELQALRFQEGDEVRAGQVLAEIDPRSYQAQLAQAQGNLARDQALLKNARLDLQRYQELQALDSIARQQVDTQAALVRQYEGAVAAGQAQVDAARLQLGYTRVTAPISGRLGLRAADRGNVVNPGDANGIVTITQVRPIDAVFAVPEAHLATLRARLAQGAELPVELWDRELRQVLARGRVAALDNAIDTSTGSIRVKARFANEDGSLYPNQFVNVKLQVNLLENALTVPATAVQNNYVYLVQEDGTVTQRRIRVGVVDGDRVSVQGDLPEGAQVVTDGMDRLREGARVTVIDAQAAAAKTDQAAQDASTRRAEFLKKLTPEQRERLAALSPEERKAFIRRLRTQQEAAQGGAGVPAGAASGAASAATAPASTPAATASR